MAKPYQVVGLGGTFDHFHDGHKAFLQFASRLGLHLHLGLTQPKLTQGKPYAHLIESYHDRKVAVKKYCGDHHISCHVTELTDIYGPTLENSKINALAVTEETAAGADKINEMRQHLQLPELPVHICPMVRDAAGVELHADRIRAGQVSRTGEVYEQVLQTDLTLTAEQRSFFHKPQGEFVKEPGPSSQHSTYIVGDHTLERFLKHHWPYELAVFDRHTQRQKLVDSPILNLHPDLTVNNPTGHITRPLVEALKQQLQHILINGEEDLAAVALMLLLPLQSKIYYGQPDEGLIEMTVTEEKKQEFYRVLS